MACENWNKRRLSPLNTPSDAKANSDFFTEANERNGEKIEPANHANGRESDLTRRARKARSENETVLNAEAQKSDQGSANTF